jgi:nuclear transport factor 2 (NTF2) superfamily protein
MEDTKFPISQFSKETVIQKIQMAENAWKSKDPVKISKAYLINSEWRSLLMAVKKLEN